MDNLKKERKGREAGSISFSPTSVFGPTDIPTLAHHPAIKNTFSLASWASSHYPPCKHHSLILPFINFHNLSIVTRPRKRPHTDPSLRRQICTTSPSDNDPNLHERNLLERRVHQLYSIRHRRNACSSGLHISSSALAKSSSSGHQGLWLATLLCGFSNPLHARIDHSFGSTRK